MEKYIVLKKEKDDEITLDELSNSTQQFSKLILNHTLEFIESKNIDSILNTIKNKLSVGGRLIIQGYDLYEIGICLINDAMPSIDFNNIIQDRKQLLYLSDLVSILIQLQYQIISKDIDSNRYLIEVSNGP